MGLLDYLKNGGQREMLDSRRAREAENLVGRMHGEEQLSSTQPNTGTVNKLNRQKDRSPAQSHEPHEVRNGDSLSRVARERYGDSSGK